MGQCCHPLTLQLKQSGGQRLLPGSVLSFVHHDNGSRTQERPFCEI